MSDTVSIVTAIVQAGATVVLVCVTISYVKTTRLIASSAVAQAKSALSLAEEAEAARFAEVRPVIEIQRLASSSTELIGQALRNQVPTSLPYRLRNIGVGPALNASWSVDAGGETSRLERGALRTGEELDGLGRLVITLLANDPPRGEATVQYQDVYANCYESSLQISFDPDEDGGWVSRDVLKVRRLDESGAG